MSDIKFLKQKKEEEFSVEKKPLGSFMTIPYEPMVRNPFLVSFPEELGIPDHLLKSTSRPTIRSNNFGLMEWDDIEFKFYDPIASSVQQTFFNLINNNELIHYRIEIKIKMLDPTGVVISEWEVNGFIKEINFADLSYDTDEITDCTLIFGVNYAILRF